MELPKYFYFRVKPNRKGTEITLEDASDADVVEVVRCKDCKHCFVDGENVRFNVCELNHNKVQGDDWFCADGRVKDARTQG